MVPYSYNMVDMGGIDLAEANGTVVPDIYEKIVEAMNLCGDLILYNWKFAGINIVPSAYTVLQQAHSILINGLIQVTELDQITVIGLPPPLVPVSPLTVSANGIYEAEPPASGFNPVTVNVESTILSGTEPPRSDYGENGEIYLQYLSDVLYITNVRMLIYGVRSNGSDTQLAEIQLLDSDGNVIEWGTGEATSNGNIYSQDQTPIKAFDNITNDKWYTNTRPSQLVPVWIDFAPSTAIPLDDVVSWQWWTGNDSNGRDPVTFELMLSFDGGLSFYSVDYAENVSITTNRNSLAYTHAISDLPKGNIIFPYCKVNGTWQNLIGTNINDVN